MNARNLSLKLPLALVAALLALVTLGGTAVFAQDEGVILVDKPDPIEMVTGVTTKVEITVQNVAGGNRLQITSIADPACSSLVLDPAGQDSGNDGIMESGETWTYTCTLLPSTSNYINTITVNALVVNMGNAPVVDSDSSDVIVYNYGINVEKVGNPDTIPQGAAAATFDITIRNTGPNDINSNTAGNLVINDAQCDTLTGPMGDNGDGILSADGDITDGDLDDDGGAEEWTYTCTINSPLGDKVENTVVVTALDVNGNSYADSDSATIEILNPGLNVVKSTDKDKVALSGGTTEVITWTFQVYNTGETVLEPDPDPGNPLSAIDDTGPAACPPGNPANQVDANIRFVDGDTNNNGDLDPGEVWIYECARRYNATGIKENTVNVAFSDANGILTDSDTAQIEVIQPGIEIEKTPFVAYVLQGQDANFTVKVTNFGQGNLTDVMVEDIICTNAVGGKLTQYTGDDGDGILEPDNPATTGVNEAETWTYSCVVENVQADDTNVAVVTAKDISGNTVSDTTTANIKMINPNINIEKSLTSSDPILQGDDVTFNLRVTTSGNAELSNVVVTDPMCKAGTLTGPTITNDDGDNRLDPGEIWDYQCTVENVMADFTNLAAVTALQANTNTMVSDDDTLDVNVRAPGLQLDKEPPFQTIREGEPYSWTLKIRNTGEADLTPDIGFFDPGLGAQRGVADPLCVGIDYIGGDDGDGILNADDPATPADEQEEWRFACNGPILLTFIEDEIINTALARFVDDNGNEVNDIERATVEVIRNIIDIEKSANPQIVVYGGTTQFTFQVRNFSAENLTDVKVTDDMCPGGMATYRTGDDGDNVLEPTEVWTYDCTSAPLTNDIDNYAEVTAKQPSGNEVRDTDNASVQVLNAKIDVNKTTDTPVVQQGDNVDFKVEVKNTGTLQLDNVVPVDDQCTLVGPTTDPIPNGRLDPGETWEYTCTVTNVQNDFVNNVSVTAKEVGTGLSVSGSDSIAITVNRPGINIQKTADQASVQDGGTAYFTVIVSNNSNIDLTSVNPMDAFCPLVPVSLGDGDAILEQNETWVYSCAVPNVQGTNGVFVNTASVSASANGIPVSDSASASVTVIDRPDPGNPGIDVEKTPDSQVVEKRSDVTFNISVSNSGDEPLTNVVITDPLCTPIPVSLGNGDATLDVGETWTYICIVQRVRANLTNTASASGQSPSGQTVSDSDSATVTIAGRKILLEKSPSRQTLIRGMDATFEITLNNPTAEDMTNVVLSDPQCDTLVRENDAPGNNDNVLDKGETWRWTCVIMDVQRSFTNKAKVTVNRPNGRRLRDTARARVVVVRSNNLRVTTSPEDVTVLRGANLPIDITVTNVGKRNYVNVAVSHDACTEAPVLVNAGDGDDRLSAGESWVFTCTVNNIQSEVNAAAVVTAADAENGAMEEADALNDIKIFNGDDQEPEILIFLPILIR